LEYYQRAANQGYALAQNYLGFCYDQGKLGVKKDTKEAFKWFKLAADQGNSTGQCNLGSYDLQGTEVPQDFQAALKLYHLAGAQNYSPALNYLGMCYENGNGVERDQTIARGFYQRSADLGDYSAQSHLQRLSKQ